MSISSEVLAERLVRVFGDPDAIGESLTADAEWWITPTVGILGSERRTRVDCRGDVNHLRRHLEGRRGGAASSDRQRRHRCCPIHVRAKARQLDDRSYENEYSVWVRRSGDQIDRVGIPRRRLVHGATADLNRSSVQV